MLVWIVVFWWLIQGQPHLLAEGSWNRFQLPTQPHKGKGRQKMDGWMEFQRSEYNNTSETSGTNFLNTSHTTHTTHTIHTERGRWNPIRHFLGSPFQISLSKGWVVLQMENREWGWYWSKTLPLSISGFARVCALMGGCVSSFARL